MILLFFIALTNATYFIEKSTGYHTFVEEGTCYRTGDPQEPYFRYDELTAGQITRRGYATLANCKTATTPTSSVPRTMLEKVETIDYKKYYFCQYSYTDSKCNSPVENTYFMCMPKEECVDLAQNNLYIHFQYGHDPNGWPCYISQESTNEFCEADDDGFYNYNFWPMDHCMKSNYEGYYMHVDVQDHENSAAQIALLLVLGCIALFL